MSHDRSVVKKVKETEVVNDCRDVFQKIASIDPETVECTMGIIVRKPTKENSTSEVNVFVLGNVEEISKMMSTLFNMTRNSLEQLSTPPTPDEVRH